MKVLFYDKSIGFGGALVCLSLTLKYLDKEKFSPILVVSCKDNFINSQLIPYVNKYFYFKKYNLSTKIGYWYTLLTHIVKLTLLIKREKIDILHANNGLYTNAPAFLAGKICNIPTICHQKILASTTKLDHILYKYPSSYIAISNTVKDSLINLLKIKEEKIYIIYPAIEVDKFKIQNISKKKKELKIGILGCLIPWKGHTVFIKAVHTLVKMNLKFKAYIIGDAPTDFLDYEKSLKDLVNQLDLTSTIVFRGRILDILTAINDMDIMVHTSLKPEPFGRVVVESMALGKPVIATNMGGPSEIIKNKITGILIPPNNPHLLALEIKNLIAHDNLRIEMGKRAREYVLKRFDIRNIISSIEEIYLKYL